LPVKDTKKIIPFIYSTKNKTTYVLDIKNLKEISICLQILKTELIVHRDKWFPIRQSKPLKQD